MSSENGNTELLVAILQHLIDQIDLITGNDVKLASTDFNSGTGVLTLNMSDGGSFTEDLSTLAGAGGGNPLVSLTLSGNTLTATLNDTSTVDVDLSPLVVVDTNSTNQTLAVVGPDLVLTDSDTNSVSVPVADINSNDIDYISNVSISGDDITFTGTGNAFSGTISVPNQYVSGAAFNDTTNILTITMIDTSTFDVDLSALDITGTGADGNDYIDGVSLVGGTDLTFTKNDPGSSAFEGTIVLPFFSGDYNDLINQPTIPTDTNDIDYVSNVELSGGSLVFTGVGNGFDGSISLTSLLDNTDAQTLSLTGNQLSIANGNSVTLPFSADGDIYVQSISIDNTTGAITLNMSDMTVLSDSFDSLEVSSGSATIKLEGTTEGIVSTTGVHDLVLSRNSTEKLRVGDAVTTSTQDIVVPNEVYGAGWNGSSEVPTKAAVYDAIEASSLSVPETSFLRSDVADAKTAGNLTFNDNIAAVFGTGGDMQIFHTPTLNVVNMTAGNLELQDAGTPFATFARTTGDLTMTGQVISEGNTMQIKGASPRLQLQETDQSNKTWYIMADGGNFDIRETDTATTRVRVAGNMQFFGGGVWAESAATNNWAFRADTNDANYSGLWFTSGADAELYLRNDAGSATVVLRSDGTSAFTNGLSAGSFTGDGSALTNLDGANLQTDSVTASKLDSTNSASTNDAPVYNGSGFTWEPVAILDNANSFTTSNTFNSSLNVGGSGNLTLQDGAVMFYEPDASQTWRHRADTTSNDIVWGFDSSGLASWTEHYKLNSSGTPTDGNDLITKGYADANYTGGAADNLGNHTATQNLAMGEFNIVDVDEVQLWNGLSTNRAIVSQDSSGGVELRMAADNDDLIIRNFSGSERIRLDVQEASTDLDVASINFLQNTVTNADADDLGDLAVNSITMITLQGVSANFPQFTGSVLSARSADADGHRDIYLFKDESDDLNFYLGTKSSTTGAEFTQVWTDDYNGGASLPYTTYVAKVVQSGTSAPSATVLEDTTPSGFTWSRTFNGVYRANYGGTLDQNKVVVFITQHNGTLATTYVKSTITASDYIQIACQTSPSDSTGVDDQLSISLEIRIYP